MATLTYKEASELDAKTVDAKLADYRKNLFELKMQKTVSPLEKPHLVADIKRSIARLLTVKNSKAKGE